MVACGGDGDTGGDTTPAGSNGGSAGSNGGSAGNAGAGGSGAGGSGGASGSSAGDAGSSGSSEGGSAGDAGEAGSSGEAGEGGGAGEAGEGGGAGESGEAGEGGSAGDGGSGAGASGSAGSAGSAGGCTAESCGPGQACVSGTCVQDCRLPTANPCIDGTVCNVSSQQLGKCVWPGDECVIATTAPVSCEKGECGPGTNCGPSGFCLPSLPCRNTQCMDGHCWGIDCSCDRPEAPCTPAPLGAVGEVNTLNDPAFTRQGSKSGEGLFDLDFDTQCNAWGVTMISGPDYLRKVAPDGTVSSTTGVTNLNMGEVSALVGKDGQFGGSYGDVALTYICCETCGCIISGSNGDPQGAAVYDAATNTLPMKIPSTKFTSGQGPFNSTSYDTGPYGLTWGLDRTLYLGNVVENGDFYALDLNTNLNQMITQFSKRVQAACPYDAERLLVAIEGGQVFLVPTLGLDGAPTPFFSLPDHVTSIVRDNWSGKIYAEVTSKTIYAIDADGSNVTEFMQTPAKGRIAFSPDGALYHLSVNPTPQVIVRYDLPNKL